MRKKIKELEEREICQPIEEAENPISEKENLLALYQELKNKGIRSISDLENLIAKCE